MLISPPLRRLPFAPVFERIFSKAFYLCLDFFSPRIRHFLCFLFPIHISLFHPHELPFYQSTPWASDIMFLPMSWALCIQNWLLFWVPIYLVNTFTWLTQVCKIPHAQTKPTFCFAASKPTWSLHLCFSKPDPWTTSISIAWELVTHANSLPHSKPTESERLDSRPSNRCFKTFSRWFWCLLKLGTTAPDSSGPSEGSLLSYAIQ